MSRSSSDSMNKVTSDVTLEIVTSKNERQHSHSPPDTMVEFNTNEVTHKTVDEIEKTNRKFVKAAAFGNFSIVQQLLTTDEKTVDVEYKLVGQSALSLAAYRGHVEVVSLLLSYKADVRTL